MHHIFLLRVKPCHRQVNCMFWQRQWQHIASWQLSACLRLAWQTRVTSTRGNSKVLQVFLRIQMICLVVCHLSSVFGAENPDDMSCSLSSVQLFFLVQRIQMICLVVCHLSGIYGCPDTSSRNLYLKLSPRSRNRIQLRSLQIYVESGHVVCSSVIEELVVCQDSCELLVHIQIPTILHEGGHVAVRTVIDEPVVCQEESRGLVVHSPVSL